MSLLLILRLALYVQFFLGMGRFFGMIPNERVWETHIGLGVAIAILAVFALRPRPGVPGRGVRQTARFFPLLPLALGLAMLSGQLGGLGLILTHMALGLATIALVEASAGKERRALTGDGATERGGEGEPVRGGEGP